MRVRMRMRMRMRQYTHSHRAALFSAQQLAAGEEWLGRAVAARLSATLKLRRAVNAQLGWA